MTPAAWPCRLAAGASLRLSRKGLCLLTLLFAAGVVFRGPLAESAEAPRERPISIDEAVRLAVERNLELRAASFEPQIAGSLFRAAEGIYDIRLTALFDFRGRDEKPAPASGDTARTRFFEADASLERLLPTGGTASAAIHNLFTREEAAGASSRSARPEFSLTLSQPLLRGFGRQVTENGIVTARLSAAASASDWLAKAQAAAAEARDAFLSLVKARSNLQTRKISLDTAKLLHAENEARVRAGLLAAIELLESEFGVAQREKDLLEAEKEVRDAEDRLRVLLQLADDERPLPAEPGLPSEGIPAEKEAVTKALTFRPELASARFAVQNAEFNAKTAENAVLPSLSFSATAGVFGLAGDLAPAIDDMTAGRYPFWAAGLSFSYPLGNRAAREDLAAARLREAQAKAALASLEASIGLEVRSAARDLESKRKQLEVAQKQAALAEARLASYLKRAKVGLATTKDALQAESDRVAARDALTAARADVQRALTRLWKETGELLGRHGIRLAGPPAGTPFAKEPR